MEVYLKELLDAHKKLRNNSSFTIDYRGVILTFESCNLTNYSSIEQTQILERFFYKCLDDISDPSVFHLILDHLYAGDYILLSTNIKSYLFETLELLAPKQFLPWIFNTLDNEEKFSHINIHGFTTYVDSKRKRGSTNGEIRYTIICENAVKLLELIESKIYRDRLTSKHVWLAIFRLKQNLSMTCVEKDIFNDWLGIV